jgi:hypothetical protein
VPENILPPRSKMTKLLKFIMGEGKHPDKLLFDKCTDSNEEAAFVEVVTSPTKALLDKSTNVRFGKFHKQSGSFPDRRLFDRSRNCR